MSQRQHNNSARTAPPPRFAAIAVNMDDMLTLLMPLVPQIAQRGKKIQREFHVTVKYFGNTVDPDWYDQHSRKLGQVVQLHVPEIVFDERGLAAVVLPTFPCFNDVPHITIACAQGTPPVYSNTLLVTPGATRIELQNVVLRGVNVFM